MLGAIAVVGAVLVGVGAPVLVVGTETAVAAPESSTAATSTAPSAPAGTDRGDGDEQSEPVAVPTGTPTSPAPTVAPSIADAGDITSASARFSGTGTPGHHVRVADPMTPSASICVAPITSDGRWSCLGAVRSGPEQVFTVSDTDDNALPQADSPAVDVIVPPTIAASGPTTGSVTGAGYPGAAVTVSAVGTGTTRNTVVGTDGRWIVSFGSGGAPLATGDYTVSATQTAGTALHYRSDLRSTASAPRSVAIDRTAPSAPTITSPSTGSRVRTQPIAISGTGESGTIATVYIDSNPVCQANVVGGSWTCTTAGESIPDGTRTLTAGLRDTAGNFSGVAATVRLTVGGAPANATPSSGSAAPGAPTTRRPRPSTSSGPDGATGAPAPGDGASSSGTPGSGGAGGSGDPGAGVSGATTSGTGWGVATAYDAAVPSVRSAFSTRTLVLVLVGVIAFLLLVAVPLKLVARSTRGRIAWRLARFTGRNRTAADRTSGDDPGMPAWATVALSIGIASVLMLLGTGIEAQARYARLSIAVALGTAVLAIGVVLATRWGAGAGRHGISYRVSPVLVAAAVIACVVTRSADLSPAVLLGVLVTPTRRGDTGVPPARHDIAARGRDATWRTSALLVLAAVGWVLHSAVTASGFWGELGREFAITLCVGGLGSLVTTLLPVSGTAGAALWATSRGRYAGITSIGVALAVAVYSGPAGTHVSTLWMLVAVVGCAVVGLVTWTWIRVVEPVLRT
ncbi:hypothetical protein [Curtobacterium sp. Leaf261]|uniref:hypothetical protein n=1 Tax=Curtobacterium sp. Leaf261 TaxID=1736311 RepID=UPI0006F77694|nr:hypothetical protein [Curtobacterium sp. Leaf261]KQO62820.1 hypothetical protein ASF23_07730 [Curtobacterium sp. Leaf261]